MICNILSKKLKDMKKFFLFFLIFLIVLLTQCNLKNAIDQKQAAPIQVSKLVVDSVLFELNNQFEVIDYKRMEKGVKQVAKFWRPNDGGEKNYINFCKKYFINDPSCLDSLFNILNHSFKSISTNLFTIDYELKQKLSDHKSKLGIVEDIFSLYDLALHLSDDFYCNKIAFVAMLNFPYYTMKEKQKHADLWSEKQWASVRLGDIFIARIPTDYKQSTNNALSISDKYLSGYYIYPGCLVDNYGRQIFSKNLKPFSLMKLHEVIRGNYMINENGLAQQQMMGEIILHIIKQDIPDSLTYDNTIRWDPFSNVVSKDGEKFKMKPGGFNRYAYFLNNFIVLKAEDQFFPFHKNFLDRTFNNTLELPQNQVELQFEHLCSSPLAQKTASLISKRLNRPLQPFDIWYNGFSNRSELKIKELDKTIRSKYPNNQSYITDIPNILFRVGFDFKKAQELSACLSIDTTRIANDFNDDNIVGSRPALHFKVGKDGMNFQEYVETLRALGMAVGIAISSYNVETFFLKGTPNAALNQGLAFVFQERVFQSLGFNDIFPDTEPYPALDTYWNSYRSMGTAILEIRIWQWLYKHPTATKVQLKDAVIRLAVEVWNQYYSTAFKIKNSPILSFDSKMIDKPLALTTDALGLMIGFQINQYLKGKNFSDEVIRIYSTGRVTPELWMNKGLQKEISVNSLLNATAEALKKIEQ